jgi:hypothetical protein
VELQELNKLTTSYSVYLSPILFVINYSIFAIKKKLSKIILYLTVLFSFSSIVGMAFLKTPFNLIFLYFFFLPYFYLMLDGISITLEKNWTKTLKIISFIHIVLLICIVILFNVFRFKEHPHLLFLPERVIILILGIMLLFSSKYQQSQEANNSAFCKIASGIILLTCWIYFSKVTFPKETLLFTFKI